MKHPFRRRDCPDLPVRQEDELRPGWRRDLRRQSLYMTLWTFLFSVIVAASIMAAAAYGFLVFFGLLANPLFRTLAMPMLLMVFILTLAAGMGRSKLRPMNDLVRRCTR